MTVVFQTLLEDTAAQIVGLAFRYLPDSFAQFRIRYMRFARRLGKPTRLVYAPTIGLCSTRCYTYQDERDLGS